MPTSVPNFNFLARLVLEIWSGPGGGLKIKIGAADFPRCSLGDKLLHSECNGTSAQKGYLGTAIQDLHDGEDMKIYKTV